MSKVTFKLLSVIALTSISSLFGAQARPSGLDKEQEIIVLMKQVVKQVEPLCRESELSNRQWFNAQKEPMLILPEQYLEDRWEIPLDLGRFAGTPLEVIVPYVLNNMGVLPAPSQLLQRKISLTRARVQQEKTELMLHEPYYGSWIYHQWILKSDNILIHERWIGGEIKSRDGKEYQCRDGRIVCQDDREVVNRELFQEYVEASRQSFGLHFYNAMSDTR